MEHYPNSQPMDRRKWVGFDAFDKVMAEALGEEPEQAPVDNVVDLNANVVELHPELPDDAA